MQTSKTGKIQRIMSDPYRKSIVLIVWEFVCECIKSKHVAKEYFSRFIYRKHALPLSNYLSDFEVGVLQMSSVLHTKDSANMLINKLKFYKFCVENDIPTPKVIAYTTDSVLYDFLEEYSLLEYDRFSHLVENWIKQSPSKSIFIKPVNSKGGEGVFRLNEEDTSNQSKIKEVFLAVVKYKQFK